jgi:hypothetical protein
VRYAGGGEFCDGYILSIIGVALPLVTGAFSLSGTAALVPMVLHDDAVPLLAPFAVERFGRRRLVSGVAPGVQTRPSRGS